MFNNKKIQRYAKIFWFILVLFCAIGIILSKDVVNSRAMTAYIYVCFMWIGNHIINEGLKAISDKKEK